MQDILEAVKGRTGDRWGIGTASAYLARIDPGYFPDISKDQWADALKRAESTLTYCQGDQLIETVYGGVLEDEARDKLARGLDLPERKARLAPVEGAAMVFDATLTTRDEDRDGDVMEPKGADIDLAGPLLFDHAIVIGRLVKVLQQNGKRVRVREAIADTPFGRDVGQLIEFGAIRRMSHGFLPTKYEHREDKDGDEIDGWHIEEYEVMERSTVRVASNRGALIEAFSVLGEGKFHTPAVRKMAQEAYESRPLVVPVTYGVLVGETIADQSFTASSGKQFTKEPITVGDPIAADTTLVDGEKPYPNEHACRLKSPDRYERFRRGTRKHDGKTYSVIFGKVKDEDKWEEQAYRYKKADWSAAEAKKHCKAHDGKFEAASEAACEPCNQEDEPPPESKAAGAGGNGVSRTSAGDGAGGENGDTRQPPTTAGAVAAYLATATLDDVRAIARLCRHRLDEAEKARHRDIVALAKLKEKVR